MARSRNIKPGFFTNDVLGELPPLTRLLFAGIWTICDREGRLEDRPKKIRAEILPYDQCDADEMLDQLDEAGFIKRYTVAGKQIIQVLTWELHQNPHVKEAPSTLPSMDEHQISTIQEQGAEQPLPERAGLIPSFLIPDSLSLDSTPLIPDSREIPFGPPAAQDARAPKIRAKRSAKEPAPSAETWRAYAGAYKLRYGVDPVRNAAVNGQLAQLVARLGADESPLVAAWYVGHKNQFYVSAGHSVGMLLRDAEKLRTQWATNRATTQTEAQQTDKTAANFNAFAPLLAEARAKEQGETYAEQ